MEVRDGLATIPSVVDHDSEPVGEIQLAGQLGGDEEAMPEDRFVMGESLAQPWDRFPRDHEDMNGCLGIDILDRDTTVILVLKRRRNLSINDFLEEGFHGETGDSGSGDVCQEK